MPRTSEVEVRYVQDSGVPVATTSAAADPHRIIRGLPVRKVRSHPHQRHYSGMFWSATNRDHVVYESRLELDRLWLADYAPDVVRIAAQPMWLCGRDGKDLRRHVPDLLLEHADGGFTVVDVKPATLARRDEVAQVFAWTERVCASRGWSYEVWMGADPVVLANLRVHGRGSTHAKTVDRAKKRGTRTGYVYLHSIVDGFSRLAYTEALSDEKGVTAVGFINRAKVFFAAHGIARFTRVVTDNGACYRSTVFARTLAGMRHQLIRPYTRRHNGKVERYNRILAEEFLYAREWTSEAQRAAALEVWNVHYNYHRPHTAAGNRPPATRLRAGVTNVMSSYN